MIRLLPEVVSVPSNVILDAMIPREDFAIEEGAQATDNSITEFPIAYLEASSPIRKLLRKPDFQRETNHWDPDQVATFIASFLDNEVVPSLIFWDSPSYIFVLDGGHRLSALRAWIEDDYGDRAISKDFYGSEKIKEHQKNIAKRTRQLVEGRIGRFSELSKLVDSTENTLESRRAKVLFKRRLILQWVHGSPDVAQSSFYKINSQGTPLDDTEKMLIENRKKPIAIAARLIFRGGSGHKYWSSFSDEAMKAKAVATAEVLHNLLFEPEADEPLKTFDVPLGGPVSPVDALSLLVELLVIAANRLEVAKAISQYDDDKTGEATVQALINTLEVLNRVTGKERGSLGLHTAVYFYNEKAKHSKFLFLGVVSLIADKLRNNNTHFYKKFTRARATLEDFLIANKSLIGMVLQNMAKGQRIPKMRAMFDFLVDKFASQEDVAITDVIAQLGMSGRILDVKALQQTATISDETRSALIIRSSIRSAEKCEICGGRLEVNKSVSFDHEKDVKYGGTGDISNVRLVHPYCNNSKDSLLKETA